jgi:catechol 2,3-dioxygenase-like lactoylglutathione lyase family enzyme
VAGGALTGFHHLSLTVRDLDLSTEWYEALFDLETVMDEPGGERRAILNFADPNGIQLSIFYEGD